MFCFPILLGTSFFKHIYIMKLTSIISFWVLALFSSVLGAEVVPRGQLKEVTSYGSNPAGTKMFLYVPKNLKSNPAVVVALHYCTGTAQAYYQGTKWASNAEKYGFIVVYPQTPYTPGNCWDVSSKMTLTHNGGGCSNSIANMAKFVLKEYNGDAKKVFVTGESSGAMMTVSEPPPLNETRLTETERHACYLPRRLRRRKRLCRRSRRLLRQPAEPTRRMELNLLPRKVHLHSDTVGQRCQEHVPWLQRCSTQIPNLPWNSRPYSQRPELL
jgi:hypothetical protein